MDGWKKCIHSSLTGHVVHFHILTIVNNADVNIHIYLSPCFQLFCLLLFNIKK